MCDRSLVPSKFETDELLTVLGSVVFFWWSSERRSMLKNDDLGRIVNYLPVSLLITQYININRNCAH